MFTPYIEFLSAFLQQYWLTMLVGVVSALCTALYLRRSNRVVASVQQALGGGNIVEVEIKSFGHYIRIQKSAGEAKLPHTKVTQNLPPPALQTEMLGPSETLIRTNEELLYFYPENPELGIAIPRYIGFLTAHDVQAPRIRTEVFPVLAPAAGHWRPADIDRVSHVGYHPRHVPHRWNRKRYRKPYNGEFVMTGDLLGLIVDEKNPKMVTEVRAPITGRLSQFGAYEKTPLMPGAIVYLITSFGEPEDITSDGVGTFTFPLVNGVPTPPPLGSTIPQGTLLGIRTALLLPSEISAPHDLQLVRCYIEHNKPVEHGTELFAYFPKAPA